MKKRSCNWVLTLPANEYTKEDVTSKLKPYTYIGQQERGEKTGYDHWQILIANKTQVRFNTLRNLFPKGHFETLKGTKEGAYRYVTKELTRVPDTEIRNGEIKVKSEQGRRTDIERLRDQILVQRKSVNEVLLEDKAGARHVNYLRELAQARDYELYGKHWRDVDVTYIYGEAGVGKTRSVFEAYGEDMYRVCDYTHPFDGYTNQSVLCLDEYYGQIPFQLLLNLCDGYPCRLPARYADKWACFNRVYIISNVRLSAQYIEVQANNPNGWQALLRRINRVSRISPVLCQMDVDWG